MIILCLVFCARATKFTAFSINIAVRSISGGIHPRSKIQVGQRLGTAYHNSIAGGNAAFTGPTLSSCAVSSDFLHITFNESLLLGDKLQINSWVRETQIPIELVQSLRCCLNTKPSAESLMVFVLGVDNSARGNRGHPQPDMLHQRAAPTFMFKQMRVSFAWNRPE